MKAYNKIILDRLVGRPLAFLLNLFVWPLGKVARVDHDDSDTKVRAIAIAKLLGMGSIIRATPLIRSLKVKYPRAKFIFVTTLKNRQLIENIPMIDQGLYVDDSSIFSILAGAPVLVSKLWKERIDLYFDLEVYSALSTILTTLSLARNRYGFYRTSTLFRLGLNTHLVYFNDSRPIAEIYMQLARAVGIKTGDHEIERMQLGGAAAEELKGYFSAQGINAEKGYTVINPNASDLLLERRWPADYFVLLLNALAKSYNKPVFLVGNTQERGYVASLFDRLNPEAKAITYNLAGEVSLKAIMALISKADVMITGDSGLYHIASSFSIPVISLWGPVDPKHYADMEKKKIFTFYSQSTYCSPCVHRTDFPPCRGNNVCMKSIFPLEVYKQAAAVLSIPQSGLDYLAANQPGKAGLEDFDIIIRAGSKK